MQSVYHPVLGEVNADVMVLPDSPDGQVFTALGLMKKYVLEDANTPEIVADADKVLRMVAEHNLSVIEAAYWYVKNKIRFVRDSEVSRPVESQLGLTESNGDYVVEVLVRPRDMSVGVENRIGDCDDFSSWLAAILVALGYQVGFTVMAGMEHMPEVYSHVYVHVIEKGNRIALDASHGNYPGWEAGNGLVRREDYPINYGSGFGSTGFLLVGGVLAWLVWNGLK
jgi:hypothetical protein